MIRSMCEVNLMDRRSNVKHVMSISGMKEYVYQLASVGGTWSGCGSLLEWTVSLH